VGWQIVNIPDVASNRLFILNEIDSADDLFYALFMNSPVGTIIVDNKIQLLDANHYIFKYFNQKEMPVKGRLFGNLFNCETIAGSSCTCGSQEACQKCLINLSLKNVIKTGTGFADVELAHFFQINGRKDTKWFSVSATAVKHQNENYAVVTLVDITERKRREETLVLLGITDELTGLYNRRFILEQIEKCCEQNFAKPMVLAMLDVDNFKLVNDTYGHLTGDEVLKTLSSIIKKSIRYSDFAGRYGGEEFLILLPESTEQTGEKIINRIRASLNSQLIDPIKSPITFSAGVLEISPDSKIPNYMGLIAETDRLMYLAKVNGKDRNESGRI
jgi:diguanylate cyclase (GGDEF)-like protein